MAIGMSAVLIAEAICVSINNTQAAIAAVVFVFAFEACFTWGMFPPTFHPRTRILNINRMDGDGMVLPA